MDRKHISLLLALLLALLALLICICSHKKPKEGGDNGDGKAPAAYTIQGKVTIRNNCDNTLPNIPDQVTVRSALNDDRGLFSGGKVQVTLRPVAGANPATKEGMYTIKVTPGPNFGRPTGWDTPTADVNGTDVCRDPSCPENRSCQDSSAKPRSAGFTDPVIQFDLVISCSCLGN